MKRTRTLRRHFGALAVSFGLVVVSGASNDDPMAAASTISAGSTPGSGPAASTPPGSTGEAAHGVTDETIAIGIAWVNTGEFEDQANADLGGDFEGGRQATADDYAQLVVDYVNANGGIAGRQVEPVYFELTPDSLFTAEGRATAEQEMCASFTEDSDVFAMVPVFSSQGVAIECAAASDTPLIGVASGGLNIPIPRDRRDELAQWWYGPANISPERREQAMIDRLVAQGYFGEDAKVAIMVEDLPVFRDAVAEVTLPALEAAGQEVVAEIGFPADAGAPWDNYVLQLQSAGATHVIFAQCVCGVFPALFMQAAESQGYRPTYALSSDHALSGIPTVAPPVQLTDAKGIGWIPLDDLGDIDEAVPNEAAELCRKIYSDAGLPDGREHGYCDALFFLKAALDVADSVTSAGLADAVDGLGDTYVSPLTPLTDFPDGRRDGVAAVYDVAFDTECSCFEYVGDLVRVD